MNLRHSKLDLICLIAVVLISLAGVFAALNFLADQKKQLRQEEEILSKGLKDVDLADANLKHLREVLDATKQELTLLNERVPESAKFGLFIKNIDALMKDREVSLLGLQPLPAEEQKVYTKIPIRLRFKGSFMEIHHLLYDLETMNRVMAMEEITITKAGGAQECLVDLTASVFER